RRFCCYLPTRRASDLGVNDAVYLEGLVFDGVAGSGINGILFNSGASLVVHNCRVFGFSQWGILFTPTTPSSFEMSETIITNNGRDRKSTRLNSSHECT